MILGPGIGADALETLQTLKDANPGLIVVDYTHPSAVLNNLKCYINTNTDFVMGTTGVDDEEIRKVFNEGTS